MPWKTRATSLPTGVGVHLVPPAVHRTEEVGALVEVGVAAAARVDLAVRIPVLGVANHAQLDLARGHGHAQVLVQDTSLEVPHAHGRLHGRLHAEAYRQTGWTPVTTDVLRQEGNVYSRNWRRDAGATYAIRV